MPSPITDRGLLLRPPGQKLIPVELVLGGIGVDYYNTPATLADRSLARATNFDLYRSVYRTRNAINFLGGTSSSTIIHAFDFTTSSGSKYTLRVTKVGVEIYNKATGAWDSVSGVTLTGSSGNKVTYAGWNDKILITNGINGLWEITPSARSGTQIVGAPVGHQLSVFGGRVIMVSQSQMAWSVKNDNTDYTGVGSGYEDLRSTPGGIIGSIRGFYPLTDDTGLLVRADSVWQVSTTGIEDAPFRFSRILPALGAPSPYGLVSTPFGLAGIFNNGIFIVSKDGIDDIGPQVADHILANIRADFLCWAVWDVFNNRLNLVVNEGSTRVVWTYSKRRNGWTRKEYSIDIETIDYTSYNVGSIKTDSLVGTTDSLVGLTDELGLTSKEHGMLLHDGSRVYRESLSLTADATATTPQAEIRSGLIHRSPIANVTLHQLDMVYEANESHTVTWNIARDGSSFTAWSSMTLPATTRPTPIRVRGNTISGKYMQLQGLFDGLGSLQIESLVAWYSSDGEA